MNAVDIPFDHPIRRGVVSQVGLVTSINAQGERNIMAAEWAYQISYSPAYFAVHIGTSKTTLANLQESPYFGISTVAQDHGWIASVAGNHHGNEVNKIAALAELGVDFREHPETGVWTVQLAAVEMVLEKEEIKPIGDHSMVIGRVLWVMRAEGAKDPLLYHEGKYYKIGDRLHKPPPERLTEIEQVVEKYKKKPVI